MAAMATVVLVSPIRAANPPRVYRIDHVADGDTVTHRNGQRVRLVQIDTPEVYFRTECYGHQASALTKRLLPAGIRVRLYVEPATDRADQYGAYCATSCVSDRMNLNVQLVGAAAPYFYGGRRGKYASQLERLALGARARKLGLWGQCTRTPYAPTRGVSTRR
jgi:endonuclease YncB( thermonuclease family)